MLGEGPTGRTVAGCNDPRTGCAGVLLPSPRPIRVSTDPDGEDITIDGTIKLCQDLDVDPEDVVLLAVAYELKSPSMGQWERKGWVDGWKALG